MNEVIEKKSFFNRIQDNFKKYFKIYLLLLFIIFIFFASFQFYLFYQNDKLLKTSILYNSTKLNTSNDDFEKIIDNISKEKNFFGILARLDKIDIYLVEDNINAANENYLYLLNNKKLDKVYKAAIAIHGSYSFLNKINIINQNKTYIDISNKIKDFLIFVDPSIDTYVGFRLEILYLLSIIEQDIAKKVNVSEQTEVIYQQIQENDKISTSLKQRVKKIHEFQKYK